MSVAESIRETRERIEAACQRAGRDPKEVTLLAVSKTKPISMLQEAYDAGQRDFGENRNKSFHNALDGLLPKSMIPVFVRLSGIDPEKKVHSITKNEREKLNTVRSSTRPFSSTPWIPSVWPRRSISRL